MRVAIQKAAKKTEKGVKMKSVKKKKVLTPKQIEDSISETISFVIKGKLTPIKPKFVAKKTTTTPKKDRNALSKQRMLKKVPKKEETARKLEKGGTKRKMTKTETKKRVRKEAEVELGKSALLHQAAVKAVADKKSAKQIKKVKVEEKKVKAEPKRRKSPVKPETPEKEKPVEKKPKKEIKSLTEVQSKPEGSKTKCPSGKPKPKKVEPKKSIKTVVVTKKAKPRTKGLKSKSKINSPKRTTKKRKADELNVSTDDTSAMSDEITLDLLRQQHRSEGKVKSEPVSKKPEEAPKPSKKVSVKLEQDSKPAKQKPGRKAQKKKVPVEKPKIVLIKKRVLTTGKDKVKRKEDQRARKSKLFGFWNGPKRHRVASLNALAKVHCLYENESRSNLLDCETVKTEVDKPKEEEVSTMKLRSGPGRQGVGKHWDQHDTSSSSDESDSAESIEVVKPKPEKKPEVKKRRNRSELMMDLKDMVVRKRMASLNASAILAASYSVEKRTSKSPKSEDSDSEESGECSSADYGSKKSTSDEDVKKGDGKLVEVRTNPSKKVSVILNQDTDVTITGVYVNSTTRSTHHEGYCSIAGMQYRISATSHTQTAATAVASETLIQSASNSGQEHAESGEKPAPSNSYTPLTALSSMQPPGSSVANPPHVVPPQHVIAMGHHPHPSPLSPLGRRPGCASAFSAPPPGPYGPPPAHHHHPHPAEQGYIHGYYQPAGPLISASHGHSQSALGKSAPLSEASSSSPTPPPTHQAQPHTSTSDTPDSDVIITSVTNAKDAVPPQQTPQTYRYAQYPAPHPGYPYGYPPQYYPIPPPAPPTYSHHDLCYPPSPYLHPKAYPPTYRRYLPAPAGTQYYQANPPDLYGAPPPPNQQNQQVVSATPTGSGNAFPTASNVPPTLVESYPPPPTLVETYPSHYFPGYGPPPPACYTHSPPTRTIPYINATYQPCPCPMQSCPKNVHTGPLTGDSKRSHISSIAKESVPLPPVALALPLEPVSATGPPSPARGSAGMPPPPSPAGATYQPAPPTKQELSEPIECKPEEKRRKARVGKNMVRNNIAANFPENTMLLMCHAPTQNGCFAKVKREVESPEQAEPNKKDSLCDLSLKSTIITEQNEIKMIAMSTVEGSICIQNDPQIKCLKAEVTMEESPKKIEILEPCQKTVAENVKVKNMKRKLSVTKDLEKVDCDDSAKKPKTDKALNANGSYKDLIKRSSTCIKINNGRRKLIERERCPKYLLFKTPKIKLKRNTTKRKLSPSKEETVNKRLKTSKPLAASNLHNSKQNVKESKNKVPLNSTLSENKEPSSKPTKQTNSKNNNKKLAPAILDRLIANNNVERTIESVVQGYCEVLRTNKRSEVNPFKEKLKILKAEAKLESVTKSTNCKSKQVKCKVVPVKTVATAKRKTKSKSTEAVVPAVVARIPRKSLQFPRWSNGWSWEGDSFQAKIFLNSDEATVARRCYPAMRHIEGDIIEPKDCILLKAGPRKNDLPYVAKVAALWENPEDGEMMVSLLWYYRPEHTDQGRQFCDEPDEVFASRHKDTNSVACIEDKCYVLTFNEYSRYRKVLRRLEEGLEDTGPCIPNPEPYPRSQRQPPATLQTSPDLVFFCRRVYDFRQKRMVKNPT